MSVSTLPVSSSESDPTLDFETRPPFPEGVSFTATPKELLEEETVFVEADPELVHRTVSLGELTTRYTFEPARKPSPLAGGEIAVITPGFGGMKFTSRALRRALADEGVPAVSYEPLRGDDRSLTERLADPQRLHEETLSAVIEDLDQVAGIRFMSGDGPEKHKVILLPHSMGGLAATRYALGREETVDSVLFLQSVGFGSPNLPQLVRNMPRRMFGSLQREFLPFLTSGHIDLKAKYAFGILDYYLANPARTIGEIRSCLTDDLDEMVLALGASGINTAYAHAEHDILVTANRERTSGVVHLFEEVKGIGHLGPQSKPDRVARWAVATETELHRLAA